MKKYIEFINEISLSGNQGISGDMMGDAEKQANRNLGAPNNNIMSLIMQSQRIIASN